MENLLQRNIAGAVGGTEPFTTARNAALATVRWILATEDGRFVAVDDRGFATLVSDPQRAAVYDGRDNEELKLEFFEALLGVSLTVVLLD